MTDKLVERLREKHHNGQFTTGHVSFGPDGHKTSGGEKIMVYRNPDGPEAANEIERLQAALESLTPRPQTSDLERWLHCYACGAEMKGSPDCACHQFVMSREELLGFAKALTSSEAPQDGASQEDVR